MFSWLKSVMLLSALLPVLVSVLFLSGCGRQQDGTSAQNSAGGQDSGKISVVTTIFPPYDFVREIAGNRAELKMLLKPGEESHSYEPDPQDIIAIEECDVFIYTGGENDVWVEDILSSMRDEDRLILRMTDCVDTVEEEHVEGMKESPGHDHDEHDMHSDSGTGEEDTHTVHEIDEHVWTSPVNAVLIVDRIKQLLIQADPSGQAVYEENAAIYEEKLTELDRKSVV